MHDWRQDHELTRADFGDQEQWLKYVRSSGLEMDGNSAVVGPGRWQSHLATETGPEAQLYKAIYGHSVRQYQLTWRAQGLTEDLGYEAFKKAYGAVALTNRLGSVMNVHICITWNTVGVTTDARVIKVQGRYLERFRKWCQERNLPVRHVWVLERGSKVGLHSHILASVPIRYAAVFRTWARRAIHTVTGRAPVDGKGIATVNIGHRHDRDWNAQWLLFRYIMKGVSPLIIEKDAADPKTLAEIADLHLRPQGLVSVKRTGVSRSIDHSAQQKAVEELNWLSALDEDWESTADLYSDRYLVAHQAAEQVRLARKELLGSLAI